MTTAKGTVKIGASLQDGNLKATARPVKKRIEKVERVLVNRFRIIPIVLDGKNTTEYPKVHIVRLDTVTGETWTMQANNKWEKVQEC